MSPEELLRFILVKNEQLEYIKEEEKPRVWEELVNASAWYFYYLPKFNFVCRMQFPIILLLMDYEAIHSSSAVFV